jgi:hypothetical protein
MTEGIQANSRIYSDLWHRPWVRVGFQALLVVAFSALTAVAKKAHVGIGIPSSSAIYWLSAMVLARCTMKWHGAGTLTGVGTALWGISLHLNQGFAQNLASFAIAGLVLDAVARVPWFAIRRWWGAMVCALAANLAQFGIIVYTALTSAVVKHFQIVGLTRSVLLHIGFGLAAGLIGWLVFRSAHIGLAHFPKTTRRAGS